MEGEKGSACVCVRVRACVHACVRACVLLKIDGGNKPAPFLCNICHVVYLLGCHSACDAGIQSLDFVSPG